MVKAVAIPKHSNQYKKLRNNWLKISLKR